ncbi:exported hypothetical protein [Vibrio nigripulchritudo FTn2]|uniref:hypothetical protein n=1 Tax=Vibrio nigripulchritudo TaxID=28173 RepID=UPI0003B199B4|nr:hypothetical protein [Vibrio nigripulchritudo]CCN39738.1 exported hypothetical protein [Vibrio nigripulchritudo FTn2]
MKTSYGALIGLFLFSTSLFAKVTLEDGYRDQAGRNNAHLGSAPVGALVPSEHGIQSGKDTVTVITAKSYVGNRNVSSDCFWVGAPSGSNISTHTITVEGTEVRVWNFGGGWIGKGETTSVGFAYNFTGNSFRLCPQIGSSKFTYRVTATPR